MVEPLSLGSPHLTPWVADDERCLALVVQAIDAEAGLHAWPVPLNVVRRWTDDVSSEGPADPALPELTAARIQAVLGRLGVALPCPSDSGWAATICQTATERGQKPEATAWVITVPAALVPDGDRWAAQRAFPPVRYWPSTQRPTGALRTGALHVAMDDTIDGATVLLAAEALREHTDRLGERRMLRDAATSAAVTDECSERARPRL